MAKIKYNENEFLNINDLEDSLNEQDEIQETQIFCSSINIPEIKPNDFSSLKNTENPVFIAMGKEFNMVLSRVIDRMPAREAECLALSIFGGKIKCQIIVQIAEIN